VSGRRILKAALSYVASGLSIIPIKPDGSKAPVLKEWKPFQFRRATEAELREWFDNDAGYGIAIIGGTISNSLEILDCDAPELFSPWCELLEPICRGLLARLVIVQTPSAGYHIYYRCKEVEGNQKLAQRLVATSEGNGSRGRKDGYLMKVETLFETRGIGGYVLAPESPFECHPHRKPYLVISGDLRNIPTITPHERAMILDTARSFNEYIRPERVYQQNSKSNRANRLKRPGDDYNVRASWFSLLTSHGWKCVFRRGEVSYWRRPGKAAPGISATTNYGGSNLLYVFSTNAAPFEGGAAYSLFSAYTLLEHNGDFQAAAQALTAKGYGKQKEKKMKTSPLEPVQRPEQTITLSVPRRPLRTIRLPKPTRPARTTIINREIIK
jgi:Bifunctional DNA primase/polymerase, N-terminal